ncbi:MAG: hypothetical protein HDT07_01240 [Bacteroidales bacterium]|nr:hypothetical protein [Bacteroidales bacterium]
MTINNSPLFEEVWLSLPLVRTSKNDAGTSKMDSTVNSVVNSVDNQYLEQENEEKEEKELVKEQVNLTETQKEVLIYLLDRPSASLKACSDATGASAMSIRYTFKKVKAWLDIHHEGPDKTGIWIFELIKKD